MSKNINRRDFLKGTAMSALGLAAASMGIPALAEEKGLYTPQCHLVNQIAAKKYLREKMIYQKESHLLFFDARQKDRWTSARK